MRPVWRHQHGVAATTLCTKECGGFVQSAVSPRTRSAPKSRRKAHTVGGRGDESGDFVGVEEDLLLAGELLVDLANDQLEMLVMGDKVEIVRRDRQNGA
jgi:hypothetical protein